jgi:hypothetical protein
MSNFSKRFNKMYNKIPTRNNPIDTSAKITYASVFDQDLFLLLREKRSSTLAHMQYASLDVESNILAIDKLRGRSDRERRKQNIDASPSDTSGIDPKVDELTKMVKSLSSQMEKLNIEGRQANRNTQDFRNMN